MQNKLNVALTKRRTRAPAPPHSTRGNIYEIERVAKHFSAEQLEQIDKLTRSVVKKILHYPITDLRENHANGREDAEQ